MSSFTSDSSFCEDEPGAPIVPGSRSFLHNLELEPSTSSITPIISPPDQKHQFLKEEDVTRAGGEGTTHIQSQSQSQSGHHWDVEEESQHIILRKELNIQPIPTHQHRRTLDTLVIITPPTSSTTHTTHIESSTSFSSSSSSSSTSSSPQLTVAPFFIEHGTSFVCTTTISSVMSALSRVLDRMNVDYTRKPEKNKIKGVYHHNTLSCPFQIRLYRSADEPTTTPPSPSTNQSILVEFQRRNGCPLTFHTFYQQTSEYFWEELDGNSSHQTQGENDSRVDVSPVDDASVVLLYGMASSPYHDVSKEGLRALAHVSYTDENQVKLSHMSSTSLSSLPLSAAPSPATLSLLQHVLSSNDDEMRRIASILVNNLSHQDVMRTPIVTELLDAMVTILESPVTIESRESQRQVVKALATMSETHSHALCAYRKNKQTLSQILTTHATSQDQTLQSYVKLILQRLQGVTQ